MLPRSFVYIIFFIYGTIFPCYWSHKALKYENDQEIKQWLTHWIIFTSYLNVLYVTNVLFGFWLPFYNEIILLVFFWLTSPSLRGSGFLYNFYFSPALSNYEENIEDRASEAVSGLLNSAMKLTTTIVKYTAKTTFRVLEDNNITILNEMSYFKNFEFSTDLLETKENAVPNSEENVEAKTQNSVSEHFDRSMVYEDQTGNMVCDVNKLLGYFVQ